MAFTVCHKLTTLNFNAVNCRVGYSGNDYPGWMMLTSVTIGAKVKTIPNRAFYKCYKLASITIPEGVTRIGEGAFYECESLTSITIPESVTNIESSAFSCCTKLTDLTYNAVNCKNSDSPGWLSLKSITIGANVETISDSIFYRCDSLASIIIPEGVTSIGGSAFRYCSNLASISIPKSVTSIGERAFSDCSNLTSIIIPEGVTSIGESLFYNCSSLASIIIPKSVTSIGGWTFSGCSNLASVSIPESVTSIGACAFRYCSNLTSIVIPKSVTSIGGSAFQGCSNLTSITIPESVTSIGSSAFYNCTNLTDLTYNATNCADFLNTSSVPQWTDLRTVTIGENVTKIPNFAFLNCSKLTSISIPEGVTSIGKWAFFGCISLTSITIPEGVTSIGESVFYNCSGLASITIPESVTDIKYSAFYNCNLINLEFNAINCTIDFDFGSTTSYTSPWASVETVSIGENVEHIPTKAFANCTKLSSITLPESITSIGESAFHYSALSVLIIPKNVTSIGHNALCGNSKSIIFEAETAPTISTVLYSSYSTDRPTIYIPLNSTGYTSENNWSISPLEKYVFFDENLIYSVWNIDEKTLEVNSYTTNNISGDVELKESIIYENEEYVLKSIGYNAFAGTDISSIIIPENITRIKWGAFTDCSHLTAINYNAVDCSDSYIYNSEFANLRLINIGENVVKIPEGIFSDCTMLDSITVNALTPPVIREISTFQNVDRSTPVYVPAVSLDDYKAQPIWQEFTNFIGFGDIKVSDVTLNKTTMTLKLSESATLTAKVFPENATNKNISWKSDNSTIASVSNGVITALSVGTATITVTAEDGNKTANCIVTVLPPVKVDSINLNKTNTSIIVGSTETLMCTVNPANADNQNVAWSSSNTSVATVANGVVSALSVGTATITVTTEDGGFTANCTVSVTPVKVTSISLNKTSASIIVGNTEVLNYTINPANAANQNVTWSSSDTDVASITNGAVVALSPGTATITVTTEDGNKTASCIVTVLPIEVESIDLNKTSTSIIVGTAEVLSYTLNPTNATNKNVTWSSSNTAVASVANGVVVALSPGTATITVKTEDGNKTARCIVNVKPITIAVTSVSLNKSETNLLVGESELLTHTIVPAYATNQNVVWSSNNAKVAHIENGLITALSAGTAIITVKTEDGNKTASCTVVVNQNQNSLGELQSGLIYLYPNPVQDGFFVAGFENSARLVLSDLSGRIIRSETIMAGRYVSISDLPGGVYIVVLKTETGTIEHKIIKM